MMKRTHFAAAALALVCLAGCTTRQEITPEEPLPEPGLPMLEQHLLSCAVETVLSAVPVITLEAELSAEEPEAMPCTEAELELLAKMVYGEARGCSKTEQAACVWVVLNRVMDDRWADTIAEVVTQSGQFVGYREGNPVLPELLALAEDVVLRWAAEQSGETYVGRVIPENYYFWCGDGVRNYFRQEFEDYNNTWGWTMNSPYEEQ